MQQRVRLPRASSKADRHLRQEQQQEEPPAAPPPEQQQQGVKEEEQAPAADAAQLVAALNEIKARDVGSVLEGGAAGGGGGATLRWATAACASGLLSSSWSLPAWSAKLPFVCAAWACLI